jgi:hypothetical protein
MHPSQAIRYEEGESYGPHGAILIRRTRKVRTTWYGRWLCPWCSACFDARIRSVVQGKAACGCVSPRLSVTPAIRDDE